jgi:hypothetical protein
MIYTQLVCAEGHAAVYAIDEIADGGILPCVYSVTCKSHIIWKRRTDASATSGKDSSQTS